MTQTIVETDVEQRIEKFQYLVHAAAVNFRTLDYHDAVSAGYVGLLRAAERFDESLGRPFEKYAYTAIFNAMRDAWRRKQYREKNECHLPEEKDLRGRCDSPPEWIVRDFVESHVKHPTDREIFVMWVFDGLRIQDISNRRQISYGTAYNSIQRSKAILKEKIEELWK